MSEKIGLILGPGALRGAYGAGVASVLGRHIDFHRVYGSSVGAFAATFLVTKQFDIMLDIWRNYVHGKLLINFKNPLRGRNILDLEYLTSLFKKDSFALDLDKVSQEKGRLIHVFTDCLSGEPEYFYPDGENILDSMIASSAVPYTHPAVRINDRSFCDGALSDPYPLQRAFDDGNDRVIVVSNFCSASNAKPAFRFSRLALRAAKKHEDGIKFVEASSRANSNVSLLRSSQEILHNVIDTDRVRINARIDDGIQHAEEFLRADGSF